MCCTYVSMVCNLPEKKRIERRTALELKIGVLECCMLPFTRTDISYAIKTPYTKSMIILNDLIELGLVIPSNKVYSYGVEYLTTTKGGKLLREYDRIQNELKDFIQEMNKKDKS